MHGVKKRGLEDKKQRGCIKIGEVQKSGSSEVQSNAQVSDNKVSL
jgi:hypothetical protein